MITDPLYHKKELTFLYVLAFILLFIRVNLGLGLIVGLTTAIIHQALFVKYVDGMLFSEKFSVLGFIIGYVFRFMILIFAIASAFVWPQFVSIYSIIFGLFVLKLLLYVKGLSFKKGENR